MKRVHVLLVVLLGACVLLVAHPAGAVRITNLTTGATLFQDDFEDGTVDDHPNGGAPGSWDFGGFAPTGSGGDFDVNGPASSGPGAFNGGSQYLEYDTENDDDLRAFAGVSVVPSSGDILHAEMMVYVPSSAFDGQGPNIVFQSGLGGSFGGGLRANGADPTKIDYLSGGWDSTGLTISLDAWHKWEIEWEVGSGNATFTIDDTQTASVTDTRSTSTVGGLTFESNRQIAGGDFYYVDATGPATPPSPEKTWRRDASGDWNDAGNWSGGVPDDDREIAIFSDVIQTPRTVFTDSDVTVQAIQFVNSNTYAIAGTGSVTLQTGTSATQSDVIVFTGDHEFQTPVHLNNLTDVTVASGSILIFNNALNLGGQILNKKGDGDMSIRNDLVAAGGTINVMGGVVSGNGTVSGILNNESGVISPGNNLGAMNSVVPEPSTEVMLAWAMFALTIWARRRPTESLGLVMDARFATAPACHPARLI